MKNILVLYTGGTIGMTQSEHGLRPDTAIVNTALARYASSLHLTWHVCQPLIDSSAVSPHDWANWLHIAKTQLPQYDGLLVLHGTDTLAYTANLFALTLDTQGKPIVFTGSQKPFSAANSDAPRNLQTAVALLQRDDLHEVVLTFNGDTFPAIGCSKVSTETDAGFANAHFGTWSPRPSASSLHTLPRQFSPDTRVLPLYFTPTGAVQAASYVLQNCPADAAFLLTYGHGNAPADTDLLHAITQFTQKGKPLLNISQVAQGCAAAVYAQGNALRQSGAIQGGKCNVETATALLMLAAHNAWSREQIESELHRLKLV